MNGEKLLVNLKDVTKLRKMAKEWPVGDKTYTEGIGTGIRFALVELGLDEEEKGGETQSIENAHLQSGA